MTFWLTYKGVLTMVKYEKVKLFTGEDTSKLEEEYNEWFRKRVEIRKSHSAIMHMPFQIFDRKLEIRNYEGEETFALAVWYEDIELKTQEVGSRDRAGNVNSASMIPAKTKRSRK